MDIVTSYLVSGTGPGSVHCGVFYILYISNYLG